MRKLGQEGSAGGARALRCRRRTDENLLNLIEDWHTYRGRLILFLGAGASVGARSTEGNDLPTARWLRDELWKEFMLRKGERFDPSSLGMMSLEHATAIIESRTGRAPLIERITKKYRTREPLWSHTALPFLGPRAVFTTNYDQLIELGWSRSMAVDGTRVAPLTPIFAQDQRTQEGTVPLFKPHGCVARSTGAIGAGGLVITMFDYFQMLTQKQALLHSWLEHFEARCAIFIGYSFMDMDIASYLFQLRLRNRDLHWYAVFPRSNSHVRNMYFEKFGIRQIDRKADEFLAELDAGVGFLPEELKPSRTTRSRKCSSRTLTELQPRKTANVRPKRAGPT